MDLDEIGWYYTTKRVPKPWAYFLRCTMYADLGTHEDTATPVR